MKKTDILKYCKYYHGEKENPYKKNTTNAIWWNGEQILCNETKNDKDFFYRLINRLQNAIKEKHCTGILVDESIPIEKRTIIYYLDLWHGRFFPYDSFDVINTY
ncbi:MAG: hypothetical protein IJ150_00155 [Bacteroidales bacterium]|nr:hypothetical protein [Bacteroidales bacterium]